MSATDRKIEYYMKKESLKWANQASLIFNARKRMNIKQKDVASILYCKEQQYSAWERGISPIPARHLRAICSVFSLEERDLSEAMARDYQKILLLNSIR